MEWNYRSQQMALLQWQTLTNGVIRLNAQRDPCEVIFTLVIKLNQIVFVCCVRKNSLPFNLFGWSSSKEHPSVNDNEFQPVIVSK